MILAQVPIESTNHSPALDMSDIFQPTYMVNLYGSLLGCRLATRASVGRGSVASVMVRGPVVIGVVVRAIGVGVCGRNRGDK